MKSSQLQSKNSIDLKPSPSGKLPTNDKKEEKKEDKKEDKKEEEIKIDLSKVEPEEETLSNPIRIVPLQKAVMYEIKEQDFEPIVHGRMNGFIILKKKRDDVVSEYDEPVVEEKKENNKEDKKDEKTPQQQNKEGYAQLQEEDDENVPEDFGIDSLNK